MKKKIDGLYDKYFYFDLKQNVYSSEDISRLILKGLVTTVNIFQWFLK